MPHDSSGARRWTPEEIHEIEQLRADGCTWDEIGRRFGLSRFAAIKAYQRATQRPPSDTSEIKHPGRVIKEDKSRGEATIEVTTFSPVKTEEDAIRVAEVDLSIWYVHSWECRQWTTPMKVGGGQKPVKLKKSETEDEILQWQPLVAVQQQQYLVALKLRRKSPEILSIESLLEEMSSKKGIKLPVYKKRAPGSKRRALEVSIMDPHLGLRCFRPGADLSWSLEEAEDAFMATTMQLLRQAKAFSPFEEIVCPIGNDYFHADNFDHTTTKGTLQPEMESLHEVYECGEKLMLWFTEQLREVAPVKLLSIPGNHDRLTAFTVARLVRAFYQGAEVDDVEVDASSSPYKFWSFGVNLIGFEHGHSVQPNRLAALMANETRLTHWQGARYCEWHLGDQHRKGSAKPATFEEQGVSVEYLPSLTPANEWSRLKGYNWQKRGAMGFIYDYETGPLARLQVNFDSYTGRHLGEAA